MIKKITRRLTKEEAKQLKFGEVENLEFAAPVFAWAQKKQNQEVRFFECAENDILETPLDRLVATNSGIVIAVLTFDVERLFFFDIKEYVTALDFYNKAVEAAKNNNI